jgi:hypothetical protein
MTDKPQTTELHAPMFPIEYQLGNMCPPWEHRNCHRKCSDGKNVVNDGEETQLLPP